MTIAVTRTSRAGVARRRVRQRPEKTVLPRINANTTRIVRRATTRPPAAPHTQLSSLLFICEDLCRSAVKLFVSGCRERHHGGSTRTTTCCRGGVFASTPADRRWSARWPRSCDRRLDQDLAGRCRMTTWMVDPPRVSGGGAHHNWTLLVPRRKLFLRPAGLRRPE